MSASDKFFFKGDANIYSQNKLHFLSVGIFVL
jgi:hypothetical protein